MKIEPPKEMFMDCTAVGRCLGLLRAFEIYYHYHYRRFGTFLPPREMFRDCTAVGRCLGMLRAFELEEHY